MPKPKGYTITPQPVAGQQGPAWLRWLDHYAQEHATAVAQIAVRDFPPMMREQITQEANLPHLSPTRFEHVNPYGKYFFPMEQAAQRQGLRPLRAA